ncbi:eCIS core domain-containing protein [Streptomyces althioticus]
MRGQEDRQNQARTPGARPAKPRAEAGRPAGTTAARLLALQRTAGNAAVARAVAEERHRHDANCGHAPEQEAPSVQRSAVHQVLRSAGQPLDTPLRTEMEARLGADFGDVRLHTDAVAQRSAEEIGARAYTSGSHVVVGRDGLDKHTLAHELTHVVQQRQGPVAGTDMGDGLRVSDPSDAFERAAEANAHRVMRAPLDVQRAVEPRPAPAAVQEGGPVAVQTMPGGGERKPPPVPRKPDGLRTGGTERVAGTGRTPAVAESEQRPPPPPRTGTPSPGRPT